MVTPSPVVGVLALQGCVERHRPHLEAAGATFLTVKTTDDLQRIDALIVPGGESTTILRLIRTFDLWDPLVTFAHHKPVWGICAGAILLAATVTDPAQASLGVVPVTVQRNGYGRQLQSHTAPIDGYPVSFIRAPRITEVAEDVEIRASHNDAPVWVTHGQAMLTTFHPELTEAFPSPMHRWFVAQIAPE